MVAGCLITNSGAQHLFPSREALDLVNRRGPWSFFNEWMIASGTASTLGDVVETDFNLEAAVNRDCSRVRINWPISQPLVFHYRFRFGPHNGIPITFCYERLKNYCLRYRSLCHGVAECEEPEQEHQIHPPEDEMHPEDPPSPLELLRTSLQPQIQH